MAKRGRKKTKKKKLTINAVVYGIFLLMISVLSLGGLGTVGRAIAVGFLYLFGSFGQLFYYFYL